MAENTRRTFLADVGRGMIAGSLGVALATDLGVTPAEAAEASNDITFGKMEPLVSLMQDTPLPKLQGVLVDKMRQGTDLKTLVTAGTLANARAFGGQDYIGYHTFMALAPALDMSAKLPEQLKPFPVLKVLYRNTERMQKSGAASNQRLNRIAPNPSLKGGTGIELQKATRAGNQDRAEQILASMSDQPRGEIFNHVQYAVHDSHNVHRVVLAWRSWLAIDLVGEEYARTLLRQSVRFCTDTAQQRIRRKHGEPELWTTLPKLIDQYKLLSKPLGTRKGDDKWVEDLAFTIFSSNRNQATDAVAQSLAEGFDREQITEAISLAANLQLLHDPGRPKASNYDKVRGSVHGDSVGVHASDAANAWRNIARVSNHRNAVYCLLLAAYNSAGMRPRMKREQWPLKDDAVAKMTKPKDLLNRLNDAIRDKDQALAGAAVARYHAVGGSAKPVFDLMLRYATSEDGALHAEKFYRTVTEEFATTRKSLRWRQLIGLARVTASEFGTKAAGYDQACDLLKAKVS